MRRWIAATVFAAVIILLAVGCSRRRTDAEKVLEETREELERLMFVARNLSLPQSDTVEVGYGEPARVGNLLMTVEAPEKERRQWVALLTCENVGVIPESPFEMQFAVLDAEGGVHESFWDYDSTSPEFAWGAISPGETVRGYVGFDVPAGRTPTMVIYGVALGSHQATWRAR